MDDLADIPGLELAEGRGGLPSLVVDLPGCTGELHLHGAHLTDWTPTGHDPVLWVSEQARFAEGAAIRGGIPICFPWFGPGPSGSMKPAHGFARTGPWRLVDASRTGDRIAVTLELTRAEAEGRAGSEHWPTDFTARYTVVFGDVLDLSLTVDPVHPSAQAALHSYFRVGDVHSVTVEGLARHDLIDKLTGKVGTQQGPVEFTGETDRIFQHAEAAVLVDPGLGRRVLIEKSGSNQTVIWNPWAEKAAGFSDMADDEWQQFACVEVATLVQLTQLDARISVQRIVE